MTIPDIKSWLYERTLAELAGFGCEVVETQSSPDKPWGAYVRIADDSIRNFYRAYWQGVDVPEPGPEFKLAPKVLIVAPEARLSLQYHNRRSEHWRVMEGPVKVVHGTDAEHLDETIAQAGEVIRLAQGELHRLVGLSQWARIAEIWQHTDLSAPSNEEDIVRVQDDYGR
jgi:mannose-6-phosphate isomerase-like protein (cupin superfamily)